MILSEILDCTGWNYWMDSPKIWIYPRTCSAFYPARLFWYELESLGNIDQRFLPSLEDNGTRVK